MGCAALEELRAEVSRLREKLAGARSPSVERRNERRASSDMQSYLERRLAKVAAEIKQHVAQHHCG